MDVDEDLEDIKRLNDIINAENSAKEDSSYFGFQESDSSEADESDCDESNEDIVLSTDATIIDIPEQLDTSFSDALETNRLTDFAYLTPHLTYEEFDIITKCKDSDLKKLLILNRVKKLQLKQLNQKYYSLLMQCNTNLKYENDIKHRKIEMSNKNNNHSIVGAPYFRDEKLFPCPPNADIIKKRKNGEINIHYLPKRKVWNICTQINIKSKIMTNYFSNILNGYEKELRNTPKSKENQQVRFQLARKIEDWKTSYDSLEPPKFWDDTCIDWDTVAEQHFDDVGMSFACRAFWNLFLHPSINKSPFSTEEIQKVYELVEKYKFQNWEAIAEELNNNRSPYLVCVYYLNKLVNMNITSRFSEDEDNFLLDLVASNRLGNRIMWSKIAYFMKDRSRRQVYQRYRYMHSNTMKKMGKFSESEDMLLLCLVQKFGKDFDKIAEEMPHRKKIQLKSRYHEYLKHNELNYGNWTLEEDKIILAHTKKYGPKQWVLLTQKMKRTTAHIRHRHNVLKSKLETNPEMSLDDLPRRIHVKLSRKNEVNRSINCVDHYLSTNTLPKLEPYISPVIVGGNIGRPTRTLVDLQLINFFRPTAHIRKERLKKSITEESLQKSAQSVQMILDLLGVELNIPKPDEMENYHLDKIDKEVLTIMSLHNKHKSVQSFLPSLSSPDVTDEIPPNVNTIQALRCLLLHYHAHRNSRKSMKVPSTTDDDVKEHINNFEARFRALFRWPCLMSIIDPPELPLVQDDEAKYMALMTKKVGRPKKNYSKILSMNAARKKKSKIDPAPIETDVDISRSLGPSTINLPSEPIASSSRIDLPFSTGSSTNINTDLPIVSAMPVKNIISAEEFNDLVRQPGGNQTTRILVKLDKAAIEKMQQQKRKIIVLKSVPTKQALKRLKETPQQSTSKKIKLL